MLASSRSSFKRCSSGIASRRSFSNRSSSRLTSASLVRLMRWSSLRRQSSNSASWSRPSVSSISFPSSGASSNHHVSEQWSQGGKVPCLLSSRASLIVSPTILWLWFFRSSAAASRFLIASSESNVSASRSFRVSRPRLQVVKDVSMPGLS